jgi:fido (protein-threonine AMPylation protein)
VQVAKSACLSGRLFLFLLGDRAGFDLDMTRIRPQEMLSAMIASFDGKLGALEDEIASLLV